MPCTHDPAFAGAIDELVVMGGSVRAGGNGCPAGEANIAHDPIAAQRSGDRAVVGAADCWSGST